VLYAVVLIAASLSTHQDTSIIAAVRSAAAHEPIEVFGGVRHDIRVRAVQLLDVDGDGSPEAFVAIEPSFRQTPTLLAYTYDPQRGAHRILEGLVAGELQPVSGRFQDDHALGFGVDMTVGGDGKPVDYDRLIASGVKTGMSLVRYRTFLHADSREGFVSYVDLSDRRLPSPTTNTCEGFEFSPIEALAAGTVSGHGKGSYLVALTASAITIYHFRGVRSNGTFDKEVWIRSRAAGVTGLKVSESGQVELTTNDARTIPLSVP